MLTGKGQSKRDVVYYFAESKLGAVRIGDYKFRFIDQPNGWFGATVDVTWPILVNLRLDPFERAGLPTATGGSLNYYEFMSHEIWRNVQAQKQVEELASSFVDYPPMQKPATFNLDAIKDKLSQTQSLGE
jgi:arylsulfatase